MSHQNFVSIINVRLSILILKKRSIFNEEYYSIAPCYVIERYRTKIVP